tara:strand:+ start:78 stop:365 length:288 start_codon:yes stop_codon:yes gene_type:complete
LNSSEIIIRPLITEKSTLLQESQRRYVFEVNRQSTKIEIKKAIEEAFDVNVIKVNTMNSKGKSKRYGPRPTALKTIKKAIVQLAPGETITIFEGV